MKRTTGRILAGTEWRPAYIANGTTYVPPTSRAAWREATSAERATWQTRRDQHTVGRVWDDVYYYSH